MLVVVVVEVVLFFVFIMEASVSLLKTGVCRYGLIVVCDSLEERSGV